MSQGERRFSESLRLRDSYRTHQEQDNRKTSLTLTPVAKPVSTNTQTQILDWKATAKESVKVAGRFMETLLKKVLQCVTANPVQMAFSIAKVIIEIKDVGCHLLSWALADYYIRWLEATKTSLYNFSKKRQTDS